MTLFWSPGLVRRFGAVEDPPGAIRLVGGLLIAARAATKAHVEASILREAEHPTGLPAAVPFALVHTDEPGALRLAAALGIFPSPVAFRRMDDPEQALPLRLVVMLTVPDPERHDQSAILARLIATLADEAIARRLLDAPEAEARALLTGSGA